MPSGARTESGSRAHILHRETQIHQLAHLVPLDLPSPATIILHGLAATGKTSVTCAVVEALPTPHAVVPSAECVTARQLLERSIATVEDALLAASPETTKQQQLLRQVQVKCENLAALAVHLQRLLSGVRKFILVFDGVDRQREAPSTLLPALARLGELVRVSPLLFNSSQILPPLGRLGPLEALSRDTSNTTRGQDHGSSLILEILQIPSLTTILIVTSPRPRSLHLTGIPHIHFPPYNRTQAVDILCLNVPSINAATKSTRRDGLGDTDAEDEDDEEDREDAAWLYPRFCALVYDSLSRGAARDIPSFRSVCDRLWPAFVAPVVRGEYGTRDFSKLVVAHRALFQGETALVASIVPDDQGSEGAAAAGARSLAGNPAAHDLPYYTKYLLCAAYLASYNPARQDPVFFMKASEGKKRRKGGGGGGRVAGRQAKHRKIQRRLIGPQTFVLERLLAIYHAILLEDVDSTADIYTEIATLASLRLLTKASASADVLEAQTKWRVNVGWEYVRRIARTVDLEMENYLAE
ncbi:MAG: hypothetical protein M1825_005341 [Sarcosagium campestre]|nr:MAG: hypothetical protein M1825_005341 [Sarcosagium campestre]